MAEVETGLQLNVSTGFLVIQSRRQRFLNATRLNNEFRNGTGVRISTQTVRNRLYEFGLSARRPAVRVPLTRQHVQGRLDFARTHVRWTIRDWTPVLFFIDESRFCLDFTDKRQFVWRMSKERFHYLNVAEHDRYGKGSVMVWAVISVSGKTDLYVVENGTLTAVRYCNEILDHLVRPYAGATCIGPDFILMNDQTRPHRVHVTDAGTRDYRAYGLACSITGLESCFSMLFQPDLCSQGLYRSSRMHWLLNRDSFHKTGYGLWLRGCAGDVML